ncbi:MAG: hypothetical protein JXK16_05480 [Thiotrichales bacterium]|nr:hypothetical protein [Thiotrichales bacterium]
MRAIVFLLFVILVFFIVRFTLNRIIQIREQNREKERVGKNQQASNQKQDSETQAMVRCAECGVHLPQSEAYFDGKDTFCSEGHMQQFHASSKQKTED